MRIKPFMPGKSCENLCRGPEVCGKGNPDQCAFLQRYYEQLKQLDYNEVITRLQNLGARCVDMLQLQHEPEFVLIVHETPTNPCSERVIIKKWFQDNGYDLQEWSRKD